MQPALGCVLKCMYAAGHECKQENLHFCCYLQKKLEQMYFFSDVIYFVSSPMLYISYYGNHRPSPILQAKSPQQKLLKKVMNIVGSN